MGPVLLHIVTEKGRGYLPAESASDKMHGVVPYDTVTGKQAAPKTQVGQHALARAVTAAAVGRRRAALFAMSHSVHRTTSPSSAVAILHQLLCRCTGG